MSEFNEANLLEITELLGRATKNVEKVYGAGYSVGKSEGADSGYGHGYENGHTAGYDAGRQAEYDRFWDAYQENGNKRRYEAAFGGSGWNNESFKPKYPLIVTYAYNMFYACGVTDGYEYIKDADFSQCTLMSSAFAQCHFRRIGTVDCSSGESLSGMFSHARALVTIDKIIVHKNNTFGSTFDNNIYLENLTFEGEIGNNLTMAGTYNGKPWGERLTYASIKSIIEHLSDDVSGKKLTLSKKAVDYAYGDTYADEWIDGTDERLSAWKDAVAGKSNWTITLV